MTSCKNIFYNFISVFPFPFLSFSLYCFFVFNYLHKNIVTFAIIRQTSTEHTEESWKMVCYNVHGHFPAKIVDLYTTRVLFLRSSAVDLYLWANSCTSRFAISSATRVKACLAFGLFSTSNWNSKMKWHKEIERTTITTTTIFQKLIQNHDHMQINV